MSFRICRATLKEYLGLGNVASQLVNSWAHIHQRMMVSQEYFKKKDTSWKTGENMA